MKWEKQKLWDARRQRVFESEAVTRALREGTQERSAKLPWKITGRKQEENGGKTHLPPGQGEIIDNDNQAHCHNSARRPHCFVSPSTSLATHSLAR